MVLLRRTPSNPSSPQHAINTLGHCGDRNSLALLISTVAERRDKVSTGEQVSNAYLEVGVQLGRSGKWPAAEKAFRSSMQLTPQSLSAHAALASLLAAEYHDAEALQIYDAPVAA